ncbi:MAG: T9SS type A sorting domain-containing protein [Taibaiella sp.]|nr:T9SS type A sorting domain-containing protein [Taibaiella sp.]
MDKLAGYAGASLSSIYYNYFAGSPFSLLPVSSGQTAGITTGMFLLNTRNTGGSTIDLYHVIGNWCCTPFMTYTTISTTAYSLPADAQQLGTTDLLDVGDCRALSGFYLNGNIHFAFNCNAGTGFTGINYSRLNIAANTISSSIHGLTGFDYAYPSLASYTTSATDPSVIIGYGRSGGSVYPEIRAVNCDSAMAWSGSTLVKASTSYITGTSGLARWGDYTGAARKHNSANPSVWINGMFGNAAHNWNTWIAEIHDATTFPCLNPDTLSVTAITTTSAVLHWNTKPGAATYNVQYRPSTTATWTNTTATTNLKSLTGLTPATHYEFQVQTRCFGTDSSTFSLSDTFTILALPNSLQLTSVKSPSAVYPNPVTDNFSVSFQLNAATAVHITITDVNGRLVKDLFEGKAAEGVNEFSFNKANLAPGVYFLQIGAGATVISSEKIVISR